MKTICVLISFMYAVNDLGAHNYWEFKQLHNFESDTIIHTGLTNGVKNKLFITPGLGLNILPLFLKFTYAQQSNWKSSGDENLQHIRTHATPLYNISLSFGILKFLSAGATVGYQTAKVDIEAHKFNHVTGIEGYVVDSWKRINITGRADYYILKKQKILLYTGVKIGYNFYSMTSTLTPSMPEYTDKLPLVDVIPFKMCTQVCFGCSYYFYKIIGCNAEVGLGIGGPYLTAAGFTLRI